MDAQLEQPLAQRGHLCARADCAGRPEAEFLHEHVGRGREEDAQLIGPETAAVRGVNYYCRAQHVSLRDSAILHSAGGEAKLTLRAAYPACQRWA